MRHVGPAVLRELLQRSCQLVVHQWPSVVLCGSVMKEPSVQPGDRPATLPSLALRGSAPYALPRMPSRSRRFPWATWPTKELLQLRIKDLGVSIEGTWLEGCVNDLYARARRARAARQAARLDQRRVVLAGQRAGLRGAVLPRPPAPDEARADAAPRGRGRHARTSACRSCATSAGTRCSMRYQLHRRREWQRLFGKSSTKYPESYRPNPASKRYVQHLRRWYAQSHPDEDFAETFAVWLAPALRLAATLRRLARAAEARVCGPR